MRHPSSQALYDVWDRARGAERAPDRADLRPEAMRERLGDIFVLGFDVANGFPLRVAGTRVCSLLGRDGKGESLLNLFEPASRREIEMLICEIANELLVAVVGVSAIDGNGAAVPLELSLLPLRSRAHSPLSVLCHIVPMTRLRPPIGDMALQSWRYLGHQTAREKPRMLRKISPLHGLTVYEGQP